MRARQNQERLEASYHAALRYLSRIDPRESHPRERVRELFERAEQVKRENVDGDAYVDHETGTLLVTSGTEIITLWPDGDSA